MNTPYYLIDEAALRRNLEILRGVRERTGCKILLAQKAFSMFAVYPIIAEYLDGATASGLFEARLAAEELRGENHVFSAAYRAEDIPELARYADHESNPLYPVPREMDAKELERLYRLVLEHQS